MTDKKQNAPSKGELELSAEDLEQIDGAAARLGTSQTRLSTADSGKSGRRRYEYDLTPP